jgi:hypothetical protein
MLNIGLGLNIVLSIGLGVKLGLILGLGVLFRFGVIVGFGSGLSVASIYQRIGDKTYDPQSKFA